MMTVDDVLLGGEPRGLLDAAMAFFSKKNIQRPSEVVYYLRTVYAIAPIAKLDPAMVIAQASHETGYFTSSWWRDRLNPAGLGITGDAEQNKQSKYFKDGREAAIAQMAHLQLYANGDITDPFFRVDDPRYAAYLESFGIKPMAQRLSDMGSGVWAADDEYAEGIVKHGNEIFPNIEYQLCVR